MLASGEHNIILFNEFNKFSNEPIQIKHFIYLIPLKRTQKELLIVKYNHFFTDTPLM